MIDCKQKCIFNNKSECWFSCKDKIYEKGYADGSLAVTMEIRDKVINECIEEINRLFGNCMGEYVFPSTICNILEQLKGENK